MKKIIIRMLLIVVLLVVAIFVYGLILVKQAAVISEGALIPNYENPEAALLVIDIQEGTSGRSSMIEGLIEQSDSLIRTVNHVIDIADSNGMPVIYITQENENWLVNLASGKTMAKGSPGADIDRRVNVVSDNRFSKTKQDAFSNPNLEKFLRDYQVAALFITGLDAAYCVNSTSFAALNRGYKVNIIQDAIIASEAEIKNQKIAEFKKAGMNIISSKEFH
ncbi:cysteine hydrolase [candidate division KSB1 bacterium]|nr:cysteine hydrolase [candidate division KSB1 bacterium]